MNASDTTLVLLLALGIIACAAVATRVWRRSHTRGRRTFAIATYSACFWMLGDVIGRLSTSFTIKYLGEIVRYFGVVNTPVWTFAFVRVYSGRRVSTRMLGTLLVIPAVSLALMATSRWHHLFFEDMIPERYGLETAFGPYFWYVHLPYCYLLTILSIASVLSEIGRVPNHFRRQMLFLCISLCVPFAINIAGMMGWLEGNWNTALSFPVFVLLLSVGIFRHRLLDVNPIAYESVFQNVRDGVIILSRDDTILDINSAAAQHTGQARTQLLGAKLGDVFAEWRELLAKCSDHREVTDELSHTAGPSATHYAIHTAHLVGIDKQYDGRIVTLRDITAQKQMQGTLEAMAYVDPLTRLPNRRRLNEEAEKLIQRAARRSTSFALLYFDLNSFKPVNDTFGHETGDELLKYVGARAAATLRAPDFVARLGGDEFVVLLHDVEPAELPSIVSRLVDLIEQPFEANGHTLTPSLSVGAAVYPQDGESVQALLRHADLEMYRRKALRGVGAER